MKINTSDFDAQALRDRILDLATRGRLVPQNSKDEPASILLKKIKLEREKLVKAKRIRKSESLPEVTDNEKPFNIPNSWEWTKLGNVVVLKNGKTPRKEDIHNSGQYPYFKVKDMNNNELYMKKVENYVGEQYKSKIMPKNTIIFPKNGGAVLTAKKRILIQDSLVDLNTGGIIPPADCDSMYIFYLFSSLNIKEYVKGSAVPTINSKKLKETLIPLPPLAEQKRIADKISQLFEQIDKIESASQQYTELQSSLRSKLLDVAMRGKLVKQDFSDEPVSVLLDEIKSEKDRLVKEKRIRNSKPLPEITDNEKPYDIPNNWEWVRLGDIIVTINGDRGKNYPGKKYWQSTGRPFLNAACLTSGKYIDKAKFNYISDERYELLRSGFVNSDDILYCIRGSLGKVGMVNIDDGAIASSLIIIRKIIADQNMEFLYYLLCSSINGMFIKNHRNGTAQPNIPGRDLLKMVVPLPPLEEQKRIVDKLEKIFAYL